MSYKRVIEKKGKSYGPYIYESYRDKEGNVKKRYLGKSEQKNKTSKPNYKIFAYIFIGIFLLILVGYSTTFSGDKPKSQNFFSSSVTSVTNFVSQISGFVVDGVTSMKDNSKKDNSPSENSDKNKVDEKNPPTDNSKENQDPKEKTKEDNSNDKNKADEKNTDNQNQESENPPAEQQPDSENIDLTTPQNDQTDISDSGNESIPSSTEQENSSEQNSENITEPENLSVEIPENISIEIPNNTTIDLEQNITLENSSNIILENKTEINFGNIGEISANNLTNFTEIITNETISNQSNGNISGILEIQTFNSKIIVGQSVKWVKSIKANKTSGDLTVEIPKTSTNITVKTDREAKNVVDEIQNNNGVLISGQAVKSSSSVGILTKLFSWLKGLTLTGNVISEEEVSSSITETSDTKEINISDIISSSSADEVNLTIEYYTEAPTSSVEENSNGKTIVISAPEELNYTNITAFSNLDNTLTKEKIHLYHLTNGQKVETSFLAFDTNGDDKIEMIEWLVPHLSNQTYQIIYASDAEHLDENRSLIENVYDFISQRDDNWTTIPDGHYLRVTFERNLTSKNDITIYARAQNGSKVEVYTKDGTELIALFENIRNDNYTKIYLTNLTGEADTFDLRSAGDIEYDYVVDPGYCSGTYDISCNGLDEGTCGSTSGCDIEYYCTGSTNTLCSSVAGTQFFCAMYQGCSWDGDSCEGYLTCTDDGCWSSGDCSSCASGCSNGDYNNCYGTYSASCSPLTDESSCTSQSGCTWNSEPDYAAPTYSGASVNTTSAGASAKFNITWYDNIALDSYIFSTNNSGSWANDSSVTFQGGGTSSTINTVKTLTSSEGISVGYRWYARDAQGNWNSTSIYTLTTTGTVLDITYPTSSNPKSVSNGDNISVNFNFQVAGTNITSGVTVGSVLIGGQNASLRSGTSYGELQTFESSSSLPSGWTTGGTNTWNLWTVSSYSPINGSLSAYSGNNIGDNEYTWTKVTKTFSQSGSVNFNWKVSSEPSYDYLIFCLDKNYGDSGCTKDGADLRISGEVTQSGSVAVSSGTHTFLWAYAKDGSTPYNSDSGWVDNVNFSGVATTANQFAYISGVGWQANVTVPSSTGYQNLFVNATYSGVTRNETETNAINYGGADTTAPTYSNVAVNSTLAGNSTNFSITWNDNTALNPNGRYFFSTNNTGTWVNDSAAFSATPSSVSVVKTLNSTVGISIGYRWYANDTANNWNSTPIYALTTTVTAPPSTISSVFISPPTPTDGATSSSPVQTNTSISTTNGLSELKWNWNGTNYTLFNNSLALMYNFENKSSLGENNTRVFDVSGHNNNGTVSSATWSSSGKYGGAYTFDGSTSYISIPNTASAYPATLSYWAKTNIANNGVQVGLYNTAFWMAGGFYSSTFLTGINNIGAQGSNFINNDWNHVAIVQTSSSSALVYVNGKDVTYSSTGDLWVAGTASSIGRRISASSYYYNGSIDEVAIYNRSLSASEIYELYASNLQKFNSTQWYLYVNQSKNSTASLDNGAYTYFTSAKDSSGTENKTETRTVNIGADTTAPTYSNVAVNSTLAGNSSNFSITWNDNTALHPNGRYFFSTNNTGTWVNDSAAFSTTPSSANVIKTLNSTVGISIGYRWYANDTAGNWNTTPIYTLTTTATAPSTTISASFISPPTPDDGASTLNTSIQTNTSISTTNGLSELKWNWNGNNYTLYNDSLVLMYNFENKSSLGESSSKVVDVSGHNNNGTPTNAVWTSSGKYGGAYTFDGTNDYIYLGDKNNLDMGTNDITVSVWVKYTGNQVEIYDGHYYGAIAGKGFWGNVVGWGMGVYDNTIAGQIRVGGTTADISSPLTYNDNVWHQAVLTVDRDNANGMVLYIDGKAVSTSNPTALNGADISNALNFAIGTDDTGLFIWDYSGSIDEVQVYNRSLSASEVYQLYASNLQKFNSTQWYFYVNQSKNSTASLDDGAYTYFTSAKDSSGTESKTETRTVNIGVSCQPPASGDWLITTSQLCENRAITINGNVNVTSGNELKLNNVSMFINQTVDYDYDFIVDTGANLTAYGSSSINETGDNNYVYLMNYGRVNLTNSKTSNKIRHLNDYPASKSYLTNSVVDYAYYCSDPSAVCIAQNSNITNAYIYFETGVTSVVSNLRQGTSLNLNISSTTNPFNFNLTNSRLSNIYIYNSGGKLNLSNSNISYFYHYNYNYSYIRNTTVTNITFRQNQVGTSILLQNIPSVGTNVNTQVVTSSGNIFNLSSVNFTNFGVENSYQMNVTNSTLNYYYGYTNSNSNFTSVNFSDRFRLYTNAQSSLQNSILDSASYSILQSGSNVNFVQSSTPNRIDNLWLYEDGTIKIDGYVNIANLYEAWTNNGRFVNRFFPFNVTSTSGTPVSGSNISLKDTSGKLLNWVLTGADGIADVNYTSTNNGTYGVYKDGTFQRNISLFENTYPSGIAISAIGNPVGNKFTIQNNTGATVASIDSLGSMYLKGTASQSQSSLSPSANSFIIQNSTGATIAYVNNAGSLYLKGIISTSSDMSGKTSGNLEVQDSTGATIAFFDNAGNLKLKGGLAENSNP